MTMAALTKPTTPDATTIEQVLLGGDLSKLTPDQKLAYYRTVCDSLGLNPLTRPFDYITLNGKLTLYARKDCTDQLRNHHHISITVPARELVGDVYVVTARATRPDGRTDESTGAVAVSGLKGDALANAYMKAETKAKRRVTLSLCGLGMLDESEAESITSATVFEPPPLDEPRELVNTRTGEVLGDAPEAEGLTITKIYPKDGKKPCKVLFSDGSNGTTFDPKLEGLAVAFQREHVRVIPEYETKGKWTNLVNLKRVEVDVLTSEIPPPSDDGDLLASDIPF